MKKILTVLTLLAFTITQIGWITFDQTIGNYFHELVINVDENTTYDVWINPNVPTLQGVAISNLNNLRHVVNGEQGSFQFRGPNNQNLGFITTVNVFSVDGPSFRPVGRGQFTTPPGTVQVLIRLGTISSPGDHASERNNLVGNFSYTESGLLDQLFVSGGAIQYQSGFNAGFAQGLSNATGTSVNAVTAFIPQMLGVTFAFFFQVLSFQVFGVSALTILGTLLALSIGILTFKLFFGR